MNRILLSILFCVVVLSCKKEQDTSVNTTTDPIGSAPSSFTRKVLIEHFTGEWNPNCPTGDDSLKAMLLLDTLKFVAVSIHQGDWLAKNSFFDTLSSHLGGVSGFPRATFNRTPAQFGTQIDSLCLSIYNWRTNLLPMKLLTAECGLAIQTKLSNETLVVNVHAASNLFIHEDTRLNVYLIEDSIVAQNQLNAPVGYIHNYVLRKVITKSLGDTILLNGIDKQVKSYSINIAGNYINKKNLKIVAFLHKIGSTVKEHEVLNVQEANLNETKLWD